MKRKGSLAPLEEKKLYLWMVKLKNQTAKRITIEGKKQEIS